MNNDLCISFHLFFIISVDTQNMTMHLLSELKKEYLKTVILKKYGQIFKNVHKELKIRIYSATTFFRVIF